MANTQIIIGRKTELEILDRVYKSSKSEFLILYGRRRVGKTFLVNQKFEEHFTFSMTALANTPMSQQLINFQATFNAATDAASALTEPPTTWFQAFQSLIKWAAADPRPRKVIFFDELPWFDAYGSDFLSALEHFWNSWASLRSDVLLIGCGSAASWMINKLIHNHGGLHNRITERIALQPFTLAETELFLKSKGAVYDRYQLLELYMTMGGIPHYLENVQVNRSVAQNIDRMFFTPGSILNVEYYDTFRSLFSNYEKHITIVEALAQNAWRDRCGRPPRAGTPAFSCVTRGRPTHERLRRRSAHAIHRSDLVSNAVARNVEPASAAIRVKPTLQLRAFDVLAEIQILAPLLIGDALRSVRTRDMRFAARRKFGIVARAAVGAGD